jgi:hypothetical protein
MTARDRPPLRRGNVAGPRSSISIDPPARAWPWLCAAVVGVIALRLALGLQSDHPHLFPDEMGYLGAARVVAQARPRFALGPVPFYYPLYSALISPALALGLARATSFLGVMVINALLGGATTMAVYAAVRRLLDARPSEAAGVALLAGAYPGISLVTVTAWAENALPLAILVWLLAADSYVTKPSVQRAAWWSAAAIGCYLVHPRGVVVVGVTAVSGVLLWVKAPGASMPKRTALSIAVAMVIGYGVSRSALGVFLGPLYRTNGPVFQDGAPLSRAVDPSRWWATGVHLVGLTWYQVVASAGLAAIGAIEIGRLCRAALRTSRARRRFEYGTLAPAFAPALLLLVAAALAVGAAAFLGPGPRADKFVAGRYLDVVTPLFIASGALALLRADRARRLKLFIMATMSIAALTVLLEATTPNLDPPRPFVADMSLGILGYVGVLGGLHVLAIGGVCLLLVAGMWVASRRTTTLALALTAIVFTCSSLYARQHELARPFEAAASLDSFAEDAARLAGGAPVGVDLSLAATRNVAVSGYQWFASGLETYDLAPGQDPRSTWLIGPLRWSRALDLHAALVEVDPSRDVGLYVLPGPAQADLKARGAMLPIDFPAIVPAEAARSSIKAPPLIEFKRGESISLAVDVAHLGSGYRWPRYDPAGAGFAQAHVRIGVRVSRLDDKGGSVLATYFADLPTDLLPGDTQGVVLRIGGPPDEGVAPEPGEYLARIDVFQIGVGWFSDRGQPPASVEVRILADS